MGIISERARGKLTMQAYMGDTACVPQMMQYSSKWWILKKKWGVAPKIYYFLTWKCSYTAQNVLKFHEFSITSFSHFMGSHQHFMGGGLNNFAGGASWYFSSAGPCTDPSSQCMGGPEGGPSPQNVRFGATWGAGPPRPPVLGNPVDPGAIFKYPFSEKVTLR